MPRRPMRAMWHDREEGASWLAEVYELGAEQLQQSLTITVSGWGNGTAGRRRARMKLSSSWYHKIKLVMPEMTKQYAEPSKMFKHVFFFFFFPINNWDLQIRDIMDSPVVTSLLQMRMEVKGQNLIHRVWKLYLFHFCSVTHLFSTWLIMLNPNMCHLASVTIFGRSNSRHDKH